jgi:hypothetical protein
MVLGEDQIKDEKRIIKRKEESNTYIQSKN